MTAIGSNGQTRAGLLAGRHILVTGVLTPHSLAFAAAREAINEGAEVVLTSYGKARRLAERAARTLDPAPDVLELDVTDPDHWAALTADLRARWPRLDGALHAVAYAPPSCLGKGMLGVPWDDVAITLRISTFSLASLAELAVALSGDGRGCSIVGLDFDNRQAWPNYDWMGVAKSGLESTSRYLARDLGSRGIRVNLVAAGPLRSTAARSIPAFASNAPRWVEQAPLGWDPDDPTPVGRACVALWSDLLPATTGEIIHVDGGCHAVGAPSEPGRAYAAEAS
jgi:enoyl-[acyl-carrier protein] reductase I